MDDILFDNIVCLQQKQAMGYRLLLGRFKSDGGLGTTKMNYSPGALSLHFGDNHSHIFELLFVQTRQTSETHDSRRVLQKKKYQECH